MLLPGQVPAQAPVQSLQVKKSLQRIFWLPLLLTFLVVLSPHMVLAAMELGRQTQPVRIVTPAVSDPWRAEKEPPSDWMPAFQNASATLNAGLVDALGKPVGLHISYYR